MKKEEMKRHLEYLEYRGFLDYGVIINRKVFEDMFKIEYSNTWEYLGPFLCMKEFIEENGYLCTTKDLSPGELRMYSADEMADRASTIITNVFRKIKKLQNSMVNAKTVEFSSKERQKHMLATNKVSSTLNSIKSTLFGI